MSARDLESLRRVGAADVFKAGALAASFTRGDGGEVAFAYYDGYRGAPVASSLRIEAGPRTSPGGGLPPFFANLLPEGHRLTVLRRETKTSADDELTLLLAIGTDTPGDVQVVPAGEVPAEAPPLVEDDPAALDFRALTDAPDRHGIPGVQAKASATMLTAPFATERSRAILKVDPLEYPHLVRNEALHLGAARVLGLPVAEHRVVEDRNHVEGLLVTRFDRRIVADGTVHRRAMEDGAQVLDVLPAAKYAVNTEDVITALAARTAAPMVATRALFLQVVFAWLTGNGDLHAKNLAILQGEDGRWRVAPVYDVPCTVVYRDLTMALTVDGRVKRLRRRHFDALAGAVGLPERAADGVIRVAVKAAARIDLAEAGFTGSILHGAERELSARRARFEV